MKPTATRWLLLLVVLIWLPTRKATAQGTTAALQGVVTTAGGETLPGANVLAVHEPTGTHYGTVTNADGQYKLLNMRVGGPYTVTASFVGYETTRRAGVRLQLSETQTVNFTLKQATTELEQVEVTAERDPLINFGRTGAATNVSTEQLEALPSIERSLTDFARLVPQYSGGGSFAGFNDRYNSIQIDGATLDDVFGLGEAVPGSQAGTQPITLDAIKEINVEIAPFDVRYSGFVGGLLNAITKSGTNNWKGSVRYLGRTEQFTGDLNGIGTGEYSEQYFVGTLGGPIIQDELFFFVAGEMMRQNTPLNATVGGDGFNAFTLPENLLDRYGYENTEEALLEIQQIAQDVYGFQPGGIDPLTQKQNSTKLLAKLDWNVAPGHRLTLRHNYVHATDGQGIGRGDEAFGFSNRQYIFESVQNSTVLQLNSTFGTNLYNEARIVYTRIRDERVADGGAFPDVEIEFTPDREVNLGIDRFSQANRLNQDLIEITNDLSYITGDHTLTLGTSNQIWHFENLFIQDFYGQYEFNELELPNGEVLSPIEAFRRGQPVEYRYSYATEAAGTDLPAASFTIFQLGAYVQDEWQVTPTFRLTAGLRLDIPITPQEPTFNPTAYEAFGRSTSNVASGNPLWSPRLGFNYSDDLVKEGLATQLRGGAGVFTGNPPIVWISNQYSNTGADLNRLFATFSAEDFYGPDAPDDGGPPGRRFMPTTSGTEPRNQPLPGEGNALQPVATTAVNLISDDFHYPQVLRTNLAIDQELPAGFTFTLEGIYSNTLYGIIYRNINVAQIDPSEPGAYPLAASKYGRPLYGVPGTSNINRVSERFTNALLLENTGKGYQYSLTVQLQRRAARGLSGSLSYTFTEAKSVNSGNSSRAISNWQFNEIFDVNAPTRGRTDYVVPHRVLAYGTYSFDWGWLFDGGDRFVTRLGVIYEGRSGYPFSWIYRGNANGDTRDDNDLVYVPATERDVVLTSDNWTLMNAFIESAPALDAARGGVVERNSASAPWRNILDVQLTQEIETFNGQRLYFIAKLENVLNWLNDEWGIIRTVSFGNESAWTFEDYVKPGDVGAVLGGRVMTADDVGKPIVSFSKQTAQDQLSGTLYDVFDLPSRWQLQLGLRYTF